MVDLTPTSFPNIPKGSPTKNAPQQDQVSEVNSNEESSDSESDGTPFDFVGKVLLLSLSEVVPNLEGKLKVKCDEAFLEDSAVKLINQSLSKNLPAEQQYRMVIMDLDDPTLNIENFAKNIRAAV